jgi:hypothetical protein
MPPHVWFRVRNVCTPITNLDAEALQMRYKANILKNKDNSSNYTKNQRYSKIAQGKWQNRTKSFGSQSVQKNYTNANTKLFERVNITNYITIPESENPYPCVNRGPYYTFPIVFYNRSLKRFPVSFTLSQRTYPSMTDVVNELQNSMNAYLSSNTEIDPLSQMEFVYTPPTSISLSSLTIISTSRNTLFQILPFQTTLNTLIGVLGFGLGQPILTGSITNLFPIQDNFFDYGNNVTTYNQTSIPNGGSLISNTYQNPCTGQVTQTSVYPLCFPTSDSDVPSTPSVKQLCFNNTNPQITFTRKRYTMNNSLHKWPMNYKFSLAPQIID